MASRTSPPPWVFWLGLELEVEVGESSAAAAHVVRLGVVVVTVLGEDVAVAVTVDGEVGEEQVRCVSDSSSSSMAKR